MITTFKKTIKPKKRSDGKSYDCDSCGLYKHPQSPRMQPHGEGKKGIMIIGEAPGEREDELDCQFMGKTGRLLDRFLRKLGIEMFDDCVCLNAVNCRPRDNRTPKAFEIDCCRNVIVSKAIEEYMPKVIILLGTTALQSVIGHRWKKDLQGIARWRGFAIPDQDLKCWICPTYHPSYISRLDDERADVTWIDDFKQAIKMAETYFPKNAGANITMIDTLDPLIPIKGRDLIAIDFETTGLKPHAAGHRIVCAAVAVDENNAYAFMMPPTPRQRKPFLDLLKDHQTGKMAHNIKYEDTWSRFRLNTEIVNWEWDSMQAAHILDNRSGITSLKFQTYVNFGVADYASGVYPYLVGSDYKNANSFNRVQELAETEQGRFKLMQYCGLDTIYEYRLAMKQIREMDYSFLPF